MGVLPGGPRGAVPLVTTGLLGGAVSLFWGGWWLPLFSAGRFRER